MHWNWLNLSALANFLTSLVLGVFVYLQNRRIAVNRIFALMSLFVAGWAGAACIYWGSTDKGTILFFARVSHVSALFISVTCLHFILELLGEVKRKRALLKICYFINIIIFFLILFFPDAFFNNIKTKVSGLPGVFYIDQPRLLYHVFTFIFFVYVNYAIFCMLKAYKGSTGIKRTQIKYMVMATLIGFGGGGSTFLLVYDIPFPPYPNILMSFYTIVLAFAIVRYRLMDIETVIHRTILWMFTSGLIVIPIGTLLYFTRSWLNRLNLIQLTLVTTALFYIYLYYYHKMQPRIDHLFRRRKYDYQTILGKVAEKIATAVNVEELASRLLTEVCEAMYLRNGALYVLDKDGKRYSLVGRRGFRQIEGKRQYADLEIFREDNISSLSVRERYVDAELSFLRWLGIYSKALEREQVEVDPQYQAIKDEALSWFKDYDFEVLVPLVFENKAHALLGLGKKENLQGYTIKDIELLKKLGEEAGVTVFNLLHYKDLLEKERLEDEMKMGRGIQMSLLPTKKPDIQRLELCGLMEPAKEIGGDYYDFVTLPGKDDSAVVIGDVSGKGVAAGLLMSMVKAAIFTLSEEKISPKELLLRLNRMLYRSVGSQKFMTLLYLLWQPQAQAFIYSSAGHEHILVFRSQTQTLETIQSGGFMLGMLPDIDSFLEERQLNLALKDKILLYTDGVTEAENAAGDRFGLEKLKESFKKYSRQPPAELIQAIKDEVYAFIGNHPQYDDITLVVLEAV